MLAIIRSLLLADQFCLWNVSKLSVFVIKFHFLSDAKWKDIYSPFEKVILRYFKIIILLDAILFENSSQNKVNE